MPQKIELLKSGQSNPWILFKTNNKKILGILAKFSGFGKFQKVYQIVFLSKKIGGSETELKQVQRHTIVSKFFKFTYKTDQIVTLKDFFWMFFQFKHNFSGWDFVF